MESLHVTQTQQEIENDLAISISDTAMFDHPDIGKFAVYLYELLRANIPSTEELEREASSFIKENKMLTESYEPASDHSDALSVKDSNKTVAIAIVGMAMKFPGGVDTSETFWKLLKQGKDAITKVPEQRWNIQEFYSDDPKESNKSYVREAGFLSQPVDQFDARFFSISPREASSMDPQQRLLLETSWEALENAGQACDHLKESHTGVFIGIVGSEYSMLQDMSNSNEYSATGCLPSLGAGRISHFLGLQGPAIAVETACSSSLVSLHLACQSLSKKECDMAIAGGVGLLLSPDMFVALCKLKALSPDGRCKSFDARGDGYGRGEGCGVIVLKRLADAQQSKDNILAVILGSAINHDGHSSGLTVPNGLAQQSVIREALRQAEVAPEQVSYIEAHGTGTSLGDPIEIQAITEVFAEDRSCARPLLIGSAKANIGHLEAASGIAGVIKVVLSIQNKMIPPHPNLKEVNPRIHLDRIPAVIPTTPTVWSPDNGRLIAGVSSFGFSGTNAHVIIAQPPDLPHTPVVDRPLNILTLSAKNNDALNVIADRFRVHFQQNPDSCLSDVCYTANTGRTHFDYRLAITASDSRQMQNMLTKFVKQDSCPGIFHQPKDRTETRKIVFYFHGSTLQQVQLARDFLEDAPLFRKAMEQCDRLFQR